MATELTDPLLQNVLVEFRNLQCPLSALRKKERYVQLQLPNVDWAHYEWWLPETAPELHVAVDFERSRTESASEKNLYNAQQLGGKVEAIAKKVGAQPHVGRRVSGAVWATAGVVFDLSSASSSEIAKKAANAMVLLVESTLRDVQQMKK